MPSADVQKDEKYARLFEIAFLSSISVNPCTSYRLLHDFSKLKRGDVIIQNAANRLVYIYMLYDVYITLCLLICSICMYYQRVYM